MAKTIEEMAHAYMFNEHLSPLNEVLHQADLNAEIQYQKDIEKSYVAGANAVLEEIDDFIFNEIQMKDVKEPHYIIMKLRKKIEQLKDDK